jgi:hypothetical protein
MYINPSLPIRKLDDFGSGLHLLFDGALIPIPDRLRFLLGMAAKPPDNPAGMHFKRLLHIALPYPYFIS